MTLRASKLIARARATMATVLAACGLVFATSANAEPAATVKARTQRMSEPTLSSRQDGWYNVDERLTLVCSTRGQATQGFVSSTVPNAGWDTLWYQTSDGHFVTGVDIATGTPYAVAPDCAGRDDRAIASAASPGRAMGQRRLTNSGAEGQCTWGALHKWFEAGGYYPAVDGDAMDWAGSAQTHGWTVVTDAQPRAILVFQPWLPGVGANGHAAWVNSVSQRSDGTWINITEMNNATHGGIGGWWTRDVKDVPGMSYILMP